MIDNNSSFEIFRNSFEESLINNNRIETSAVKKNFIDCQHPILQSLNPIKLPCTSSFTENNNSN